MTEAVGYVHKETVIGDAVIITYRVEGIHKVFGNNYYSVYKDSSLVGQFKFKGWAEQFHDVVVAHTKAIQNSVKGD